MSLIYTEYNKQKKLPYQIIMVTVYFTFYNS